ncbi:Oidioi.mRNA.OKI2018_I69.XSR.g15115.t2.cds [Oikopleura dioica]|uniref:Oidioi.mRNA.OKI2018_I69.XSR.g15115.t2.cds n=1 Tax=Oikopleura dioica TaxID=34765 RepID=A0ABN7SBU5_OIKDI|nr:Oidioi.mRNA.OKI2018_I69.XSR.g15115.t2.cds [Oikopleura dioica]
MVNFSETTVDEKPVSVNGMENLKAKNEPSTTKKNGSQKENRDLLKVKDATIRQQAQEIKNLQNEIRRMKKQRDEAESFYEKAKTLKANYKPVAKYEDIIINRMQKISDRAAKGKTEAEAYKEVIRSIPILSANQKTIWEQVDKYFPEAKIIVKNFGKTYRRLPERAKKLHFFDEKKYCDAATNTPLLADNKNTKYKQLTVQEKWTPIAFNDISPSDSNGQTSKPSESSAIFHGSSYPACSSSSSDNFQQNNAAARIPDPQQSQATPSINTAPFHQYGSIIDQKDLSATSNQTVAPPAAASDTNRPSPSTNSEAIRPSPSVSPTDRPILPKSLQPVIEQFQQSINLMKTTPPGKKRKSQEMSETNGAIDLTSDDEIIQPAKKINLNGSAPVSPRLISNPGQTYSTTNPVTIANGIPTTNVQAPCVVIAKALPIKIVNAPTTGRCSRSPKNTDSSSPESPPRKNLPRLLYSDIPECNKVKLNDGVTRILPPLPPVPKFTTSSKDVNGILQQLPHRLKLKATFSSNNTVVCMWDIDKTEKELKDRAKPESFELYVLKIPAEERRSAHRDIRDRGIKWKLIGNKDVMFHRIPVRCSLKNFPKKGDYIFIIRAKDRYGRVGAFSEFAVAKSPEPGEYVEGMPEVSGEPISID